MWKLLKEFLLFARKEGKWWLLPIVLVLIVLGTFIAAFGGSVLGPFIYSFL